MPINVKCPHCGTASMNIRSSEKPMETSYKALLYCTSCAIRAKFYGEVTDIEYPTYSKTKPENEQGQQKRNTP